MKKLLTVALIASVIAFWFDTRQRVLPAAQAEGDAVCEDDRTLHGIDSNGDGSVDISDAVHLLAWLFSGGPPPQVCRGDGPGGGMRALPDTGQATCYDADDAIVDCASDSCAGQDGFYATGCSNVGRFVDNGDGTVTDNCTGLMWQADTGNDERGLNWCSALAYCEGLELGDHSDWRLPNVRELQSIVDYGRVDPSIDPAFDAVSSLYWTSTSLADGPGLAWDVSFLDGLTSWGDSGSRIHLVRAVRGGR